MTRQLFLCTIFLAWILVVTSSNGQVKKDLPNEKLSESKGISERQPKLIKIPGSQKGGTIGSSLQDKKGTFGSAYKRRLCP